MTERKVAYTVAMSEGVGDVTALTRQMIQRATEAGEEPIRLIAVGGDGTVNEVMQGIDDFSKVWFGFIPTGSSNDLSRDLYKEKDPLYHLERILSCQRPTAYDLGEVTYLSADALEKPGFAPTRYFTVSCGIGFDAAVCEEALRSAIKDFFNKIGLGKLTYLGIALKQIIAAKKISCTITLDGGETITLNRFLFIASMIHKYEGGGFMFCPDASAQDGQLDICVAGDISKGKVLVALPTAFNGKHYRFKGIDGYRTKALEIQTSAPLAVHTDGEVVTHADHIRITCDAGKLLMLI